MDTPELSLGEGAKRHDVVQWRKNRVERLYGEGAGPITITTSTFSLYSTSATKELPERRPLFVGIHTNRMLTL